MVSRTRANDALVQFVFGEAGHFIECASYFVGSNDLLILSLHVDGSSVFLREIIVERERRMNDNVLKPVSCNHDIFEGGKAGMRGFWRGIHRIVAIVC